MPDPTRPQAWNRYSYVYNSPLSYTDPSGQVPWWLRYVWWQGWMNLASLPRPLGPIGSVAHGRMDVFWHGRDISTFAGSSFYELIVGASIAHQGSALERAWGADIPEELVRTLPNFSNMSMGPAQVRPSEIAEWAPHLRGKDVIDPDVGIEVTAKKIRATDDYILNHPGAEIGIAITDRYMLMALAQNCSTRATMQRTIDTFFDVRMKWSDMLSHRDYGEGWKEQLRFVALHIDWLAMWGWEVPTGLDMDYWRRTAFSD